jgi:mRNA-degrading endonuclease RelE of RelBE toxin-antitoxin system
LPTLSHKRRLEKTKAFSKDAKKLPHRVAVAGWEAAQTLQENVSSPTLNIKKSEGLDHVWRVVVKKDYRLFHNDEANHA